MKKLIYSALFSLLTLLSVAQVIDIADARLLPIDTEVTVTGVVTNGAELGIIRYFQDPTGALSAYGSSVSSINRHDSITITGVLKSFNGLLELDPVINFTNHGPAVNPIQPTTVQLNNISESTESMLVRVQNCVFADAGANFTGNTTYNITSGSQTGVVYIRNAHPLVGSLIPVGSVDLVSISSQFSFTGVGGYQILPRDANDITSPNAINIISTIDVDNLTQSGFTLSWVTDVPATTEIFYTDNIDGQGLTNNNVVVSESVTNHSLTLSNLNPGEVYFLRVYSVAGPDTAYSNVLAAATVSNSTGEILAYFNRGVQNDVAFPEGNNAISTNVRDTLIAYIDRAQSTIDVAVYNVNDNQIIFALNDALDRNVTVRYIAENSTANLGLNVLDTTIPVLYRTDGQGSGMHNKFMVIDRESVDKSFVITGSTNWTNNNLFTDANNMVIVQDKALAKAYTIEFNEMWGSSGNQPVPANSKFGAAKLNNTPEKFIVGGKPVELYFSPSDNTQAGMLKALETTNASVDFALMVLTADPLAFKLIEINDNFFMDVRGIMNDISGTGNDYQLLLDNDIMVMQFFATGTLHHKYAIVDHADLNSDPLVITGSHNWSASANNVNDENTLVIHDPIITNQFYQEWIRRFQDLTVNTEQAMISDFALYPNPAGDFFNLRFNGTGASQARLFITDLSGKTLADVTFGTAPGENYISTDASRLPNGLYIITLTGEWGRTSQKLVIAR